MSFILARGKLVTVRYDEPKPFRLLIAKFGRACPQQLTGTALLLELLDAIIDRAADIIEHLGSEIDATSQRIFERNGGRTDQNTRYRALLRIIARKGDLASKVRESLVSIARLVTFLAGENGEGGFNKDQKAALKSMQRDVSSLTDHVSYLGEQDHLPARRHARPRQHRAEQHHQDLRGALGGADAADADRLDLRHELPVHAGTRRPLGLPGWRCSPCWSAAIVPYWFFKWKRWL